MPDRGEIRGLLLHAQMASQIVSAVKEQRLVPSGLALVVTSSSLLIWATACKNFTRLGQE